MDVSTIRARAKRQLNEPTGDDEGLWTDDDYLNCINEGQLDMAVRLGALKTYAEFETDGTNAEFDIGESSLANFMGITEVWYFSSTTVYDELDYVSRKELSRLQSEIRSTSGAPSVYCYEDRVIEFDTVPEASKTVRVYYYYVPDTLTGDSSASNIRTLYHNALVDYVCWKFCESEDENPDKMMYHKSEYIQGVAQARMTENSAGGPYATIRDIDA